VLIPGDDSRVGKHQKIRLSAHAGFEMAAREIIAPQREPIAARRIHVSGAAIQSTFTSLTLNSACVAAKRLVMRNAPRVLT
jgi:hypothetical protein